MKWSCVFLVVLLACLGPARAETTKQKLRYLKDITGVSCSAERLTVYKEPNGPVSETIAAPAYVTVIRGKLDPKGNSWVFVSNDKTKKEAGWVKLLDLSCI